jgi:hypothetical protein
MRGLGIQKKAAVKYPGHQAGNAKHTGGSDPQKALEPTHTLT